MLINILSLRPSWGGRIALNSLVVFAYLVAGYFKLQTPLWIPSGLSLALLLVFGTTLVLPGIILGIALTSIYAFSFSIVTMGLISAQLLELLVASSLLKIIGKGHFKFRNYKDIFSFVLVGVSLAPILSSTMSVTSLYLGKSIPIDSIPHHWTFLFNGNALGILVFTPLLLSLFKAAPRKTNWAEALLIFSVLGILCFWAFGQSSVWKFSIVPLFIWIALRFSFTGVSFASLIIVSVSVWRSENDLLWIQLFTAASAIIGYFIVSAVETYNAVEEKELELSQNRRSKEIAEDALNILDQAVLKSPTGLALIDKDYRYIRINEKMAILSGLNPEDHLGKSLFEVIPELADKIAPYIDRVVSTKKSIMDVPFRGNGVEALIGYYPVCHLGSDEIFGVALNLQDISQQIKIQNMLRENQDRMIFAQEAGKIGAFEWNVYNDKFIWTPELESIYGLLPGTFSGSYKDWWARVLMEDREALSRELKKVINGEIELNHEFRIITAQGEMKWLLTRAKMLRNNEGERSKLIGISIDVTEQKNIEQKLRFTEANLLHALSVRDEFLAIASHELKTPLTSLKLQIQVYQRGLTRKDPTIHLPEKIQSLMEKNANQIDRLNRLVDDMLDISRIRTGKLTLKKELCDLSVMLRDILGRTRVQFENCGSGQPVIEHLDSAIGEWDSLRVEQVISNILSNAIRYGKGNPITISLKASHDVIRFMVRDQGLGIPKSDQEKIFKRYERGDSAREVSGLGLGLYITQQIVDAHGGKIWLESEPGKGSTFYVELPLSTVKEQVLV